MTPTTYAVIQYRAHLLSERIHEIKEEAKRDFMRQTDLEGKPLSGRSIRPGCPSWQANMNAKDEVSTLLTATRILRRFGGSIPEKKDLRKEIRRGAFAEHSPRAKDKRNQRIFAALDLLSLVSNMLKVGACPDAEDAAKHLAERHEKAAEALARKELVPA
jgi:hypothetical protein